MTVGLIIVGFFVIGMLLSAITSAPRADEEWQADTLPAEEVPELAQAEPVILTSTVESESIAA